MNNTSGGDERKRLPSRRGVLKTVPGVIGVSVGVSTLGSATASEEETVQLGAFSEGLDGWTTNGGNDLIRISEDEMPAAVRVSTHALGVQVRGDAYPMIENKELVSEADFTENPYLKTNVMGVTPGTDSDLVFTFRLHHTAAPPNGRGRSDENGRGKQVLVEESEEKTIPQSNPTRLRWNLSDVDDDILEAANRLEIVWYLEDYPPDGGHRGRARSEFEYTGLVAFDNIRLTDDIATGERDAKNEKRRQLHRSHGMLVDRVVDERNDSFESGIFVFADGTEIPFTYEILDDGRARETIDGEVYELGGENE